MAKRLLYIVLFAGLFCGACSRRAVAAMGGVKYEEKDDLFGGEEAKPVLLPVAKGGKLKVSVMPLSFAKGDASDITVKLDDVEWKKSVWRKLGAKVGSHANMESVALPSGAEKDEVIDKTIKYAAGLLPLSEFNKIKKFKLPDRFMYGSVSIGKLVEKKLFGKDKVKYQAEVFLRLVNGRTMKYLATDGTATSTTIDAAVESAIGKALSRYEAGGKPDNLESKAESNNMENRVESGDSSGEAANESSAPENSDASQSETNADDKRNGNSGEGASKSDSADEDGGDKSTKSEDSGGESGRKLKNGSDDSGRAGDTGSAAGDSSGKKSSGAEGESGGNAGKRWWE